MIPFKSPKYQETAFNCPLCGAYAKQIWFSGAKHRDSFGYSGVNSIDYAYCQHCGEYSLWHEERMIYPCSGSAPLPNPDLPDDIKFDYKEARSIVSLSPRGSAALLRLAMQKLCAHLGEKGKNINTDIANLVKKGLPSKVQKALDIVRVVGNDAVHPGQIDLKDDIKTAEKLFALINLIAEVMITQPKNVDSMYDGLPKDKKETIKQRDEK